MGPTSKEKEKKIKDKNFKKQMNESRTTFKILFFFFSFFSSFSSFSDSRVSNRQISSE